MITIGAGATAAMGMGNILGLAAGGTADGEVGLRAADVCERAGAAFFVAAWVARAPALGAALPGRALALAGAWVGVLAAAGFTLFASCKTNKVRHAATFNR